MDVRHLESQSISTTHTVEKEKSLKLSPEQLKLKEIQITDKLGFRITRILENRNIKYLVKLERLQIEPSGNGTHWFAKCIIKDNSEVKKEIPNHCLLDFKHLENNRISPILLECYRFNENIIDGIISPPLPVAGLSVSTSEHSYTCIHVAMYQTALTSLSKANQPRFLTTTHVYDCYAVVFWEKKNKPL